MVKVCKKVKCERSNGCEFAKGQVNNGGTIMNSNNILGPTTFIYAFHSCNNIYIQSWNGRIPRTLSCTNTTNRSCAAQGSAALSGCQSLAGGPAASKHRQTTTWTKAWRHSVASNCLTSRVCSNEISRLKTSHDTSHETSQEWTNLLPRLSTP